MWGNQECQKRELRIGNIYFVLIAGYHGFVKDMFEKESGTADRYACGLRRNSSTSGYSTEKRTKISIGTW